MCMEEVRKNIRHDIQRKSIAKLSKMENLTNIRFSVPTATVADNVMGGYAHIRN